MSLSCHLGFLPPPGAAHNPPNRLVFQRWIVSPTVWGVQLKSEAIFSTSHPGALKRKAIALSLTRWGTVVAHLNSNRVRFSSLLSNTLMPAPTECHQKRWIVLSSLHNLVFWCLPTYFMASYQVRKIDHKIGRRCAFAIAAMPKRISIPPHLSIEDIEAHYRHAKDPVQRTHYQII